MKGVHFCVLQWILSEIWAPKAFSQVRQRVVLSTTFQSFHMMELITAKRCHQGGRLLETTVCGLGQHSDCLTSSLSAKLSSESNLGWILISLRNEMRNCTAFTTSAPDNETRKWKWLTAPDLPQAHMKCEMRIEIVTACLKKWAKFVKWEIEMRPASLPWNLHTDLNSKFCWLNDIHCVMKLIYSSVYLYVELTQAASSDYLASCTECARPSSLRSIRIFW